MWYLFTREIEIAQPNQTEIQVTDSLNIIPYIIILKHYYFVLLSQNASRGFHQTVHNDNGRDLDIYSSL